MPYFKAAFVTGMDFPGGSDGKASAYNANLGTQRPGFNPWVGKISWRRKWQPTPVFLSGKAHGRRSLIGYSPWGRKESDTTERLYFLISIDNTLSNKNDTFRLLLLKTVSCDIYGLKEDGGERRY